MARGAITTEETVVRAIEALIALGSQPTVRGIRAQLGGGSPNVIARHLATWKRGAADVATGEPPPVRTDAALIKDLAGLIDGMVRTQVNGLQAKWEAKIAELQRLLLIEQREVERWKGVVAEAHMLRDEERVARIRAEREAAVLAERLASLKKAPATRSKPRS
ncbi:MAG: DNA-binding protein [Ferrovibrio sp.]|uniref:DNA-binding protein n=1 Tax=Ferrovibrio sp. TaxID=1917215 RepID=UPI00391DBC98